MVSKPGLAPVRTRTTSNFSNSKDACPGFETCSGTLLAGGLLILWIFMTRNAQRIKGRNVFSNNPSMRSPVSWRSRCSSSFFEMLLTNLEYLNANLSLPS